MLGIPTLNERRWRRRWRRRWQEFVLGRLGLTCVVGEEGEKRVTYVAEPVGTGDTGLTSLTTNKTSLTCRGLVSVPLRR